jgi:hypothetical protein
MCINISIATSFAEEKIIPSNRAQKNASGIR